MNIPVLIESFSGACCTGFEVFCLLPALTAFPLVYNFTKKASIISYLHDFSNGEQNIKNYLLVLATEI